MTGLTTYPVPASGGLDLVSPTQVLAKKPGAAVVLDNFEILSDGGYQKIKGIERWGIVPDAFRLLPIRGITTYFGVVLSMGPYILYSKDGATWFVVNKKNVKNTPSTQVAASFDYMERKGTGPVSFTVTKIGTDDVLVITDNTSAPAYLTVKGDLFTYTECVDERLKGSQFCTKYQDHIAVGGGVLQPGMVYMSARFKPDNFAEAGSWSIQVQDEITGLHVFRDFLYIFCKSSIYRVINLESTKDVAVRPVTTKIGCVDFRSIKEVGGDVMFLAADGLRYLGATERIDDVDLSVVSGQVRPLTNDIDPSQGPISAIVIPHKAQYRLHYTDRNGVERGLIGTLTAQGVFEWSTTSDMLVSGLTNDPDTGESFSIGSHTVGEPVVYRYDTGLTRDGSPITAKWSTPYFHMGDGFVRKRMHSLMVYLEADDRSDLYAAVKYDHESTNTMQPAPFFLAPIIEASRWGQARFGQAVYGATRYPVEPLFLEGSGRWVQLTFQDAVQRYPNASYIFRGFDIQFSPGGRI